MESPHWKSCIPRSTFYCSSTEIFGEIIPEDKTPVAVLSTGLVYNRDELINRIRSAYISNILNGFKTTNWGDVSKFDLNSSSYLCYEWFTIEDVVENTRYASILRQAIANPDNTLRELSQSSDFEGSDNKLIAFAPTKLGKVYQKILNEQQMKSWDGKSWAHFKGEYLDEKNEVSRGRGDENKLTRLEVQVEEQYETWNAEVRESLDCIIPAFRRKQRGRFESTIYLIRWVYHALVAASWYYVTEFLKWTNFVSYENVQFYQEREVGGRLAELFLQNHGMHYNYRRPETLENRIWSWVIRENRQTAEW